MGSLICKYSTQLDYALPSCHAFSPATQPPEREHRIMVIPNDHNDINVSRLVDEGSDRPLNASD